MKTVNDFLTQEQLLEREEKINIALKNLGLPKGGKWLRYVTHIEDNMLVLNVGKNFYMAVRKGENGREIKVSSPIYKNPFVLIHDFTNTQIDSVHESLLVENYCVPKSEDRFVGLVSQNKYSQYIKDITHDFVYFNKNKVFHSDIDKVMYVGDVNKLKDECNADTIVKTLVANGKLSPESDIRRYPRRTDELSKMILDPFHVVKCDGVEQ